MQSIEIDFDVYKKLTILRETEKTTYNDVLRKLLELPTLISTAPKQNWKSENSWATKYYIFPHGTEFKANYKGKEYQGFVKDGHLLLNGRRYSSPSRAAISITNNSVNGWVFWECRLPNSSNWVSISSFKTKV